MLKKFLIGTFVVAAFSLIVGVAGAAYDFGPTTLKVGSSGQYVMNVQTVVGATVDGAFGPMTKAKVMAWQASNGLTADGIVGPATKNAMNAGSYSGTNCPAGSFDPMTGLPCGTVSTLPAGCTSTVGFSPTTGAKCDSTVSTTLPAGCTTTAGYSPTTGAKCDGGAVVDTGPLAGTAGEISTVTKLSQYSSEEIGAGQENVKVLGFEVKASKDGDIGINAAKVKFTITNASGSVKLADYVDIVTVWQDSTKIGSSSAADFNKDSTGIYSKTIALSGSVVRADKTEKFYVTIDALSNLDSADIDSEVFKVGIDSLRIIDGSGVVTTDAATGDLPILLVPVSFVSYSVAANTELKISASTSNPVATTVRVSDTADTKGVVLLKGKLKLEGTSDVWLDELPITLTSTGGYIDAIANSVTLTIDGKEFTESLGTNCVLEDLWTTGDCGVIGSEGVMFDNLDLTIAAGSTMEFTVSADLNDLEAGAAAIDFTAGDSLLASLTAVGRPFIVAENSKGDQLAATEMTGSATGNAQIFRSEGVNVVMGTPTITPTVHATDGTVLAVSYDIPVTVTSFGDTLYVGQTVQYAAAATVSNAFAYVFQNSSDPTTSDVTCTATASLSTSDAAIVGSGYELTDGIAKHFTIKVLMTVPTTGANSYRVALKQLKTFTESTLDETPAVGSSVLNTLTPVENYQTNFQYITN